MIQIPNRLRNPNRSITGALKDIVILVMTSVIVLSVFLHVYNGFDHGIGSPLSPLNGDTLYYLELFKQVESGHWMSDPMLGAPFGADWADMPILSWGYLILFWFILQLTPNLFVAFNLTFLLFMTLSVVTMYLVARRFLLSRPVSALAALFFPLQPFVFMRFPNHFLLIGFFWVPLLLLAAWRIASGGFFRQSEDGSRKNRPRGFVSAALICLLAVFASGPYYAFYGALLLLTAALYSLISRRDMVHFGLGVGLSALIAAGLGLVLMPNIVHWQDAPRNPGVAQRLPVESEIYGLKLKHLLLPAPYHRLSGFQRVSLLAEYDFPLENENASARLGLLGAGAFLFMLFSFLFRRRRSDDPAEHVLVFGLFSMVLLLYAGIGGLSTLFGTFISPQLRGHSRVVIFLAVVSFLTAAWLTDRVLKRWAKGWRHGAVWTLILLVWGLALLDIVPRQRIPIDKYHFVKSIERRSRLLSKLDQIFPSGSAFLQLPFTEFPEAPWSHYMEAYDHLWPRILTDRYRWSFGLIKNSWQSEALKGLVQLPVDQLALYIRAFGFSGIWVDHNGYADGGQKVTEDLNRVFGPPVATSSDRENSVFGLSSGAAQTIAVADVPPLILHTSGWSFQERDSVKEWRWATGQTAELLVIQPGDQPKRVRLRFGIMRTQPGELTLNAEGNEPLRLASQNTQGDIPLTLKPGLNRIRFVSSNKKGVVPAGNPVENRMLNFALTDLKWVDEAF